METTQMGFDSRREFEIRIPHPDFEGKKSCRLKFPTDEQWCDRARKNVTVLRSLGRDKTRTETPKAKDADMILFASVRVDEGGAEFDQAEVSVAIAKLELARVLQIERHGNRFWIRMQVPGAEVIHHLKMPTLQQVSDFGAGAISSVGRRDGVEHRVSLEASGVLWGQLDPKVEHYLANVPIIHKDRAVTEVVRQLREEMEEDDPE